MKLVTTLLITTTSFACLAQQNLLPSWMDKVSISPEFAIRHVKVPNGDAFYGAGLDVGVALNPHISLHLDNIAYSEEEGTETIHLKGKHFTVPHDDGWGGNAIDESSILFKGTLLAAENKSFLLYGLAGPSRDWVADDWGLGGGFGLEYQLFKHVSVGADSRLRFWDKQPRDLLTRAMLNIKF
jgi:hypothetical protein